MWCLAVAVCATLKSCLQICQPQWWQWSKTALDGLEPSSRQQLAAALGHCQVPSLPGNCFCWLTFLILLHLILSTAVRAKVLKLGLGVPFLESLIPLTQLIIWKRDFLRQLDLLWVPPSERRPRAGIQWRWGQIPCPSCQKPATGTRCPCQPFTGQKLKPISPDEWIWTFSYSSQEQFGGTGLGRGSLAEPGTSVVSSMAEAGAQLPGEQQECASTATSLSLPDRPG